MTRQCSAFDDLPRAELLRVALETRGIKATGFLADDRALLQAATGGCHRRLHISRPRHHRAPYALRQRG